MRMLLRMTLSLVYDETPTRGGLTRMALRIAGAHAGARRSSVNVSDRPDMPGHVWVRVAIGWRAWVPWIRWRLYRDLRNTLARVVNVGAIPHVEVRRRLGGS